MSNLSLGRSNVYRIFLFYAVPSLLATTAQVIAGFVDSFFIGNYVGSIGIAAITMFSPVVMLVYSFAGLIAIGGSTLAGIYYGANRFEEANNFFNVCLALLTGFSILITLVFIFGGNLIFANIFNLEGELLVYTKQYSSIISMFFIMFSLNFLLTLFLRLDNMPILTTIASIVGMFINVGLDYLFVGVLGYKMVGAAIATGLSQLIPFVILLYFLIKKSKFKIALPKFHLNEIKEMFYNGSSELLSTASFSISGMIFNYIIATRLNDNAIASFGLALQISNIAISLAYGIADGVQAPISFNYGAKQNKRVIAFRNISNLVIFILSILFAYIFFFKADFVVNLFIDDQATIDLAVHILFFYGFTIILSGFNIVMTTFYTAINQPLISIVSSLLRAIIGVVIGLIILPNLFGNDGIWLSQLLAEVFALIFIFYNIIRRPLGRKELKLKKVLL